MDSETDSESVARLEACLVTLATVTGRAAAAQKKLLATAESCTGGAIARALTETAGSSEWFDRAFVTYSNQAKSEMLSVPAPLIVEHGAVSEAVARAMAHGAMTASGASVTMAVTGVAGPGGGSVEKPVGTVWFGWARREAQGAITLTSQRVQFDGDRQTVRLRTALHSLSVTYQALSGELPNGLAVDCLGGPDWPRPPTEKS
ncbi:MAG: CinA family protein [Burkholderiaceae bacterium]